MRSSRHFIPILIGAIFLFFLAPLANSSVDTTFLSYVHQKLPIAFDNKKTGILDPALNQLAHQVWQDVITHGYSVQKGTDKEMRTVFGQIQFHLEQQLIDRNKEFPFGSAVWIIHTPDIATPLVTTGILTENLISKDILLDNDRTRIDTALARAKIIRDFLAKGGIVIAAHQANSLRSQEQIAIFSSLKKQYPTQIIDFIIDEACLPEKKYPENRLGATYLMQLPTGEIVEMTNQGAQINTSLIATWGVWMQEGHHSNQAVEKRLQENIEFLFTNGLQDVLKRHAKLQGIAPEKYLTRFTRYMKGSDAPNTPCNK
ncbi:MAG: hypothetical protein HYX61_12140 [Gammaproteobacteria bacterium]|nr:hypothetical protein [Gammaproteobacteria bacterium]